MAYYNRRQFLQASSVVLAAGLAAPAWATRTAKPNLSFSTLGCPDWSFTEIAGFAQQNGYTGIELRGIQRQIDLLQCKEFSSTDGIKVTLALMKEKGLRFVNLGSSATMHFAEGAERNKNLDDGKRYIDLAQQLSCPYIRVFPNNLPKDKDKKETIDRIAKGLDELGNYAKSSGVKVLMETHGDLVHTDDILLVMQQAANTNVGIIWDVTNMYAITKQPPAEVYPLIKQYIHHTHIKDAKLSADGKIDYVFLGQGDIPIFDALDLLQKGGYKGFYSFEWEKLWHPEIAASELALADYPQAIANHFKRQ